MQQPKLINLVGSFNKKRFMKCRLFIIIVLVCIFAFGMNSCRSSRMSPAQRKSVRIEKQMKKDSQLQRDALKTKHYEIQSESTRSMMKKSKKRAKSLNRQRGQGFFERLFGGKKKKSCLG
jgi:hypothetical protein